MPPITRRAHKILYLEVDAHKATSQLTVMNKSRKVINRNSIEPSRAGVREVLGRFRQPMKAVVEASYCWGPIYDWLDELTKDVLLAHPGRVKAIAEARIKTNKISLEILAHLLRTDLISHAYAPSKDSRSVQRPSRHGGQNTTEPSGIMSQTETRHLVKPGSRFADKYGLSENNPDIVSDCDYGVTWSGHCGSQFDWPSQLSRRRILCYLPEPGATEDRRKAWFSGGDNG